MDFKKSSALMLPELEAEIFNRVKNAVPSKFSGVQEMMLYHLGYENEEFISENAKGKRIRPLLVLLSTALFNEDWKIALTAASAVELLHNFSLIHDDIEDKSALRRGRDTVWKIWGIPQAINTGDAMFTLAQISLLELKHFVPAEIALEAVSIFNQTCLDLTGGQYLDMDFEQRDSVSTETYFQMISGKTAALLSASTEIGAVIAQTDEKNRLRIKDFGKEIGLAFQIWDDWLGIWGEEKDIGKSVSTDLLSEKKTLPVLYALEQKGAYYNFVNQPGFKPHQKNIQQIKDALEKDGAKEYTANLAKDYTDSAIENLNGLTNTNPEVLKIFFELTNLLLNRKN